MSTQKNVLVTSDHKKGRHAVGVFRSAYDKVKLNPDAAQILNEATGFEEYLFAGIKRFSSKKHPQAELLEQYFAEVLGYTLDLTGVIFPEKEGFATYMAVPSDLDEDQIFSRITTHFKVSQYTFQSPVAIHINRKVEQKRPQRLYFFSHAGGDEPDANHLGKSYDDAVTVNMIFMNPKEYLLATGFHRWANKDHFMDVKGYTLISSLWSDGGLMRGCWNPSNGRLDLYYSRRSNRHFDDGPRELFLG